jgi:hypothetical protein
MSLRVVITEQAEREMQSAFNGWAEHRSKRQADRWYGGFKWAGSPQSRKEKAG